MTVGNKGIVVVWFTLLAATGATCAGEPATPKGPATDKTAATHDEIRAVRDEILKAIKAKDAEALIAYLHPEVVLTFQDGKELKAIRKHEGVREYLGRLLTGPQAAVKTFEPTVTVEDLTILHGDDTGVAFGTSRDHYVLADNREIDVPTRWSATMVRVDGKWKVANLQVSSNPFDNPVLDSVTRMIYWVGGGAGLLGFFLGLLVMKFVGRSAK